MSFLGGNSPAIAPGTPGKKSLNTTSNSSSLVDSSNIEETYNIPPSEWLSKALHGHPEILELKERIRPINNQKSYSRNRVNAKTEASHVITDNVLLKLIMQYLHEENLTSTLNKIQEECEVKFVPNEIEKDSLPTLLRIGIKDTTNGWFGILEEPWESDPEVAAYHAYVSDQDNDTFDGSESTNVWNDKDEKVLKNTEGNTLQGASLNKLLWLLTFSPNATEVTEIKKIFFLTFPSFTTAETVLNKLIQMYHSSGNVNTDLGSIVVFLSSWIEQQPLDFNDKLLAILNNFIDNQMVKVDGLTHWAKKLRTSIAKAESGMKKKENVLRDPPEPKVPKNIFSSTLTFDDIDEEEIARQLCIIDFGMYECIKSSEFLIKGWTKPQYRSKAVNLLAMMKRFNDFTKWVAYSLINEQQTVGGKGKSKLLGKFLKIAEHLKALSNFHSLMAIYGGINNTLVYRNKGIRKDFSFYNELEKLFHSDQNYKNYRIAYKDAKPPCVPFLGIHLRDLTFVDEGTPDRIGNMINLNKRRTLYRVITNTMKYQPIHYNFLKVHQISLFLTDLKVENMEAKTLDSNLSHDTITPNR